MDKCRCGHTGMPEEHPCHGRGYTCRKEAAPRLVAYTTALAGMQLKLGAYQTWACDECWADYTKTLGK